MKYFVHWPLGVKCFLNCPYCFSRQYHDGTETWKWPGINLGHWKAFRDKHLSDASDIIINFYGGCEFFWKPNLGIMMHFMRHTTNERFELLSNGLCPASSYRQLAPHVKRIDSIGFTHHRWYTHNRPAMFDRFLDNLQVLRSMQITNMYVKELMGPGTVESIPGWVRAWRARGIECRVQDLRNDSGVPGLTLVKNWTIPPEAMKFIYQGYMHNDMDCQCKASYQNIIIDSSPHHPGELLACWHCGHRKVVGNILTNEYTPGYHVQLVDNVKETVYGPAI